MYCSFNLERLNIYTYICWKLLHKYMFFLCCARFPFFFSFVNEMGFKRLHSLLKNQICDQCYIRHLSFPLVLLKFSCYPCMLCLNWLEPGYTIAEFTQFCVLWFCLVWLGLIWDLCTSMLLAFLLPIKTSFSISWSLWFYFIWAISPHCFLG